MRSWRLPIPIRAVLAVALALGVIALAGPAQAQKSGGTLTIVRPTDPVSLDPHTETTAPGAWVYYNILEPLIYLDEKMTIQPKLATSYEVMNPTKVRFKLRPNVKFHDGTPFNAAAVKFTFDRAFKSTPPARWASLAGPIAGAEVVDDLTVDIVTKEPYGPILRSMAMLYVSFVSPTAVQKMGEGALRAPVGTGPFKFVEWKTNTQIVIERNPDYWGEKALLDRVIFKVVPEEGARMIAVQTGDADMVMFPSPAQLPQFRKDSKFTVHEAPGLRVVYIGFNAKLAPLDDVRVRQALVMALDRKKMSQAITNGLSRPASNPYGDGSWVKCKDDGALPEDLEKAKALIKDYGKPVDFKMIVTATPRGRNTGQVLQQFWKQVGANMEIEQIDQATVVPRAFMRQFQLTPWRIVDLADPDVQMYSNFHTGSPVALANYSDPELDRLLEHARTTADQAQRNEDYCAISRLINKQAIWYWTFQNTYYAISSSKIKGLPKMYSGLVDVSGVWKE